MFFLYLILPCYKNLVFIRILILNKNNIYIYIYTHIHTRMLDFLINFLLNISRRLPLLSYPFLIHICSIMQVFVLSFYLQCLMLLMNNVYYGPNL